MTPVEARVCQFYEFGPFRLATGEHRLYRHEEIVLLPPKEFDLLLLLVRNSGHVMDRESLIKALWPDTVVEEANLNVHISGLRKALAENSGEQRYIETLPRLGYRFVAPVAEINEPKPDAAGSSSPSEEGAERDLALALDQPAGKPQSWLARQRLSATTLLLWLLAFAVAGVLAVLFFQNLWPFGLPPSDSAGAAPMNVVPLTTYPGHESQSAFSPDGNQIAFVWTGEKEGNTDIYVRLVDGGNWVRVSDHPGDDVNPVWSPNGRAIAFYRSATDGDGIFLVPALGGAERKLTETWANRFAFGAHTWLHWSPDGRWLVFSDKASAAEPFGLFLLSPNTGEKRRLTLPPASTIGDCSPAFSPDGRQVAFVRVVSAVVGEVYLVSVDGGEPKRLTFDGLGVSNLTWASGGREIVFSSRQSGKSRLFRIPVEGGAPQWLAASGNEAQYPAYSPQGNRLAWTQNADHTDIFKLALKSGAEAAAPLAGLIASTAGEASPRYSPDGKRIAFVSNRSGSEEIWVSGSEGENPIRLTSFRGPLAGSPSWSPDGKQLVFDCRPEGNADIFVVSSEGGQPRRLTSDPAEDIVPSWSRDGRWIYFTSNRSGRLQVWKTAAEGGDAVRVTQQGGFEPVESPDGQWLYYTQDRGSSSIWRVPAGGGQESPVYDSRQKTYTRMWTVTGEGIYFAVAESLARSAIKFFSFANGSVRTVAGIEGRLPGSVSGLTLSPDRRSLLFPLVARRGSDLMMIENFR
jgi:Tol biopolymer transport system component/DNA-binding winged helix-turn-helix (wHTH) protein